MTRALQRITTEYIDVEDRIRLAGESADAAPVVAWLTRRLLQRVLPPLLGWLEKHGIGPAAAPVCAEGAGRLADAARADFLQSFAQQAARAELPLQAPVPAAAGGAAWLVLSVRIDQAEQRVGLTFCGADGQEADLLLTALPLRQWLNILFDACAKAEWDLDVWPGWLDEGARATGAGATLLH